MLEAAADALLTVLQPSRLLLVVVGISVGLLVGIIPGLGGTVGMSLLLPFVFGMETNTALGLLLGMAAVVHTADTFPSVLLGVPGSSGSQATILDGYPLARRGEAARVFGSAFASSVVGGLLGAAALFALLPVARPLVLSLGSPELFMLAVLGLSVVGVLSGNRPIHGLVAGTLGLLLGAVGAAPAAPHYRFTFDTLYLADGIPLAVLALGLFALPEMLDLLVSGGSIARSSELGRGWWEGVRDAVREKWLVVRCSVLGVAVGMVPGLGGSVVDWISYGQAVQSSPDPERFGRGDIRGVIAPESSNNAKESGALVPTLLFGIPGSGTTAVLLGAFVTLGLQPGPNMLTQNLDSTLTIIWTLALANVLAGLACLAASRLVVRLSLIRASRLTPFILVAMLLGAYQSTRHWGDLIAFLVIGLLGWVMKHLDWPRPALLIGFVLAASAERYLWISWSRYEWAWLQRPGVLIIGAAAVVMAAAGARLKGRVGSEEVGAAAARGEG